MKKMFNHSKRPYDNNREWDDEEISYEESDEIDEGYDAEEVQYVDEDGNPIYLQEGEYVDEDGYIRYRDPAEIDTEEPFTEEEIYEDAVETEDYEDGLTDDMEEADYDQDVVYGDSEYTVDLNFFQRIWYKLVQMSVMDRVITSTGVAVLVLALVTGVVYVSASSMNGQIETLGSVGSQLDGITLIGENGLIAITDATLARIQSSNNVESNTEYDEEAYEKEVTVAMNMTSILKDLKLKFVNEKTNKLVANVPFSVNVKSPNGTEETWTDDDMDGIIYKTDITAGNYTIAMNALEGDQYADYTVNIYPKAASVKATLDYQKVDVEDEVKDESEINSKKEDTEEKETVVESALKDTVDWVESTKTSVNATYTAVPKTDITDPLTSALATKFMRLSQVSPGDATSVSISGSSEVTLGSTITLTATVSPDNALDKTVTWNSSDSSVATVNNGIVTPQKEGTTDITAVTANGIASNPFTVTVKAASVAITGITLPSTAEVTMNSTTKLTASLSPSNATEKTLTWSSSDSAVATVDSNGTVTPLKVGTTKITASVGGVVSNQCTVTVKAAGVAATGITIDKSSASLIIGGTIQLTATVTPSDASNKTVTWGSNKESVATVSSTGLVTAKTAGTAIITATDSANHTVTCTVTVTADNRTIKLDKTTTNVALGTPVVLTATIANANNSEVLEATTSNAGIATVAVSGKTITITGVSEGTATISVKIKDTSLTAVCTVTVVKRTIKLDKTTATLLTGNSTTLTATTATSTTAESTAGTYTATSSNAGVATVSVNGKTITVTGVAAGSATITVTHTENNVAVSTTCTVTVKSAATPLKNNAGVELYVLKGDKYVAATYADYYNYTTFYTKGEATYKYTGWQTINNKLYYYKADGKYVTGEQVIQGAKYNFASDGSLVTGSGTFGIDVSKWNGTIDWAAVKNSGVSYVIIRCGYRGSSTGVLVEDPKYAANIKGATAAGLKVGVYFFSQATNEVEAVEEASMVVGLVKGYTISYPIFLDVESSGGRGDKIDSSTRTAVIKAFCQTIQNSGYTAGVYANKTWLTSKMDASQLSKYKIWLAQYAAAPTYSGRYDLWQYKSTGKVSGISGDVDLNLSYLGY